MTINMIALLLGLFAIPIALLIYGKRLRRRSSRVQKAFWGATIGHLIAATAATIAGLTPAENWIQDDHLRGAAGYWALFILPSAGALIGALMGRPESGGTPRFR